MLILDYTLTEQEYLDLNFYTGWKASKSYRIKYYFNSLFGYIVLAGISFPAVARNSKESVVFVFACGIMFVFLIIWLINTNRSRFDNDARKVMKISSERNLLTRTKVTISDRGIHAKDDFIETKYTWDAFVSKVIANNCYYLYLNSRLAFVIPFRVFQGNERDEFENLLAKYFPLGPELSSLQK